MTCRAQHSWIVEASQTNCNCLEETRNSKKKRDEVLVDGRKKIRMVSADTHNSSE